MPTGVIVTLTIMVIINHILTGLEFLLYRKEFVPGATNLVKIPWIRRS